jgi:hypothetical protein
MDDQDWAIFCLCGCIIGLAAISLLHSSLHRSEVGALVRLRQDVEFLKIVARETEARTND